MKLNSLQVSFAVSVAFHALAFSILALVGFASFEAYGPENSPFTINLVAAPPEITAANSDIPEPTPTSAPVEPSSPEPNLDAPQSVPEPPQTVPEPVESIAQRIPDPPPIEVEPLPAPSPAVPQIAAMPSAITSGLKAIPEANSAGDVTSEIPGSDYTTAQQESSVKGPPRMRRFPQPPYPVQARRLRQEGVVVLRFTVNVHGDPVDVVLKKSSGFPLLDESTLRTAHAEIEKSKRADAPVAGEVEQPIRFQLSR